MSLGEVNFPHQSWFWGVTLPDTATPNSHVTIYDANGTIIGEMWDEDGARWRVDANGKRKVLDLQRDDSPLAASPWPIKRHRKPPPGSRYGERNGKGDDT